MSRRTIDITLPVVLGAFALLAVSLAGLPPELGLLFSLAQRLEQGVWTGVGFALYSGVLTRRRSPAAKSS